MPNDFLSQEEIDILLGKKDGAEPPAEEAPAAENAAVSEEPPAAADPAAPAEPPVAADTAAAAATPAPVEPPAAAGFSPGAETAATVDSPASPVVPDAIGLPAAGAQAEGFAPAPREEGAAPPNLGAILEFPLQVSIRLGKANKTLQEIRRLSSGTVVELDRYVHETLDIHIGGKLIARGEVVLIEENFGIKITEIMDPVERVKKLR
ncbi:MAG: flagellar motor switch protein FliN [Firmicutes bacterium]|nr:flagellar motor switch protein FliN [Bacillota bacterium]